MKLLQFIYKLFLAYKKTMYTERVEPMPEIVIPPDPIPPITPKPTEDKLDDFCLAIRDFEGNPGDLNYRNNNPGNCRCSPVGYAPRYGKVLCVNGFARFPTYELGWEYLHNLVLHRAQLHPNWTILDFFSNYAPASDHNSPINYARNVAGRCGVTVNTTLKELFTPHV